MTALPTPKDIAAIDIVPVALARRLLTPPRHGAIDVPIWCWCCPYCGGTNLITEELTLWPHLVECRYGPVVLQPGQEIFIGSHLLSGYPDALSDRLAKVLARLAVKERESGYESRWIATKPIPATTLAATPTKPAKPAWEPELAKSRLFTGRR
jgi:hypothetical protein